ncbi:putative protein y4jD (plasmid) [Rhizobium favelukesii]|uniref:Uncharacterized protein n=1 Tax=Rhizobium favelukesii TaxID=348824 RepID=W6RIE9_9HYPH|nr:putative protein y4jD [Rhizobium favelukesii]
MPCCSFELHCIGTDVSEALDIVPAIVRVKRTIRPRYACRACESAIVQAPAPARVMDGGMVTTAFAAHVAVSKYAWHLPLNRQAQMLASCGVIIDRGTLGAWVTRVAWWLELLYDALTAFIRSQPRVFCDETPLPRLDPGRKRTTLCQLWAQAVDDRPWNGPAPPAVAYTFAESRSAREVEGQLSSFAGVLQVDGYQAYKTMVKRPEIYRIEADLRGENADTRLIVRRRETAPIKKDGRRALAENLPRVEQVDPARQHCLPMWLRRRGSDRRRSNGTARPDSGTLPGDRHDPPEIRVPQGSNGRRSDHGAGGSVGRELAS